MNRKKQPIFVCSGISNTGELLCISIQIDSIEDAKKFFYEKYLISAKEVCGPFSKFKNKIIENIKVLKFIKNIPQKAIYNDWLVNAFMLSEPANHAYLIFIKKMDNKNTQLPKGTNIVPIHDLRIINNE